MSNSFLVDTNILVYAVSADSSYHEKAKKFLEKTLAEKQAVLAVQNLVEFYAIVTNKKYLVSPFSASQAIRNLELFSASAEVILDKPQTRFTLASLLKERKIDGQEAHDVHLAATMMDNGIETIYTLDTKIFKRLGLKALNPLH